MSPAVIDLTSSPEPNESPGQAAKNVLRKFQQREQVNGAPKRQDAMLVEDVNESDISAARAALQKFKPRPQKEGTSNNGSVIAGLSSQHSLASDDARYELQNTKEGRQRDGQSGRRPSSGQGNTHSPFRGNGGSPSGAIHNGPLASLLLQRAHSIEDSGTFSFKEDRGSPRKQRLKQIPLAHNEARAERIEHFNHFHVKEVERKARSAKRGQRPSLSNSAQSGAIKPEISPIHIVDSDSTEDEKEPDPFTKYSSTPMLVSLTGLRPFKRQRTGGSDSIVPLSLDGAQSISRRPSEPATSSAAGRDSTANGQSPIRSTSPTAGLFSASSRQQLPYEAHSVLPAPLPPAFGAFKPLLPLHNSDAEAAAKSRSSRLNPEEFVGLDRRQLRPVLIESAPVRKNKLPEAQHGTTSTDQMPPEFGATQDPPLTQEGRFLDLDSRPAASTPKPTPYVGSQKTVTPNRHGIPYTPEEDAFIIKLKEVDNLKWGEIVLHFPGRSYGSVQVRYSSKLKHRPSQRAAQQRWPMVQRPWLGISEDDAIRSVTPDQQAPARPKRRRRNNEASAAAGYISWRDVKDRRMFDSAPATQAEQSPDELPPQPHFNYARAHSKSLSRILRQRELGSNFGRSWMPSTRSVPDELQEHVFDNVGPRTFFKGTSGDVTCLAWSPDGRQFAAGSIAITDERSMQYNRPCNLLIGDYERRLLRELPEHYIPRPSVDSGPSNVNGLHSMRRTQDARLFMTVANVQFSSDSSMLFSAGSDRKVRAYAVHSDIDQTCCQYEIDHPAPLDLLSINSAKILATACHQSADGSIAVYREQRKMLSLSPGRIEEQTKRAIYPSALRWGVSAHHSNLLLAGFSIDSVDDERAIAGETCLWDIHAEARIPIVDVTRNVFDVAWNPAPSSTSTHFAVASTRGSQKKSKGTRSVVQCFAPSQNRVARVMEWECPAFDINDLVYCQHDDNLLAAGATDGKVYVWDKRFADSGSTPLHVLEHGESLNVLDHDREREMADTGVRFLSWGATSSRLYSGSSDGVVKIWDPYRSTDNAHVRDVATFTSAVMSGAFSPDYRDLLIGEDQGRINSLSIGHANKSVRAMQPFQLHSAPAPTQKEDRLEPARKLVKSGEVEFRPMGSLPIRQAVQGPKYRGPYLEPSSAEITNAELAYQHALDDQSEAYGRATMSASQSSETEEALREVDKQIQEAQDTIQRLQSRHDDAAKLVPQAEAYQRALCLAEKNRLKLEASLPHPTELCKLECNYLPASIDDGAGVPDSHRSEARIPGALRISPPLDIALLTAEDLVEAGLTANCRKCFGPANQPSTSGKWPLCDRCYRATNQFTASCELCSAPVGASEDESASKLCERCSFACFRCARPIFLARNALSITCDRCGLTWKAGMLGYELAGRREKSMMKARDMKYDIAGIGDQEHLGEGEIEHYASKWQTGI